MDLRQTEAHLVQQYSSSNPEQVADPGECYAGISAADSDYLSASVEPPSAQVPTEVQLDTEQLSLLLRTAKGEIQQIQHIYPLSPLQEGMLFHRLLNQRDTYVLSLLIELPSKSLIDPLITAVQTVIDRHEAFRSAIVWEGLPRAVQVVYRHATLSVQQTKLTGNCDVLGDLKERIRSHEELMDLTQAPLLRLVLAPVSSAGPVYAALQVHHLVCDHHSLRIAFSEIVACLDGHRSELPPPGPYTAFLAQAPENVREAEAFFCAKLGTVEEPSAPYGVLNVRGDGSDSREANLRLNSETARGIRATCERCAVTPARLFHAAWALVIARTSGSDDVVYGTVLSSGQSQRSQTENCLGLSVNTLPLRVRLEGLTARQLLGESDRELKALRPHRDSSLTLAQRCSGVREGTPLFTSILNFRHSEADHPTESECGVRLVERDEGWTNYPVVVIVDDLGETFALCTQTQVQIDPSRVARYLETALSSLTHALDTTPEMQALSLKVLPDEETRRLLDEFNPGCERTPGELQLHELFESQVRWGPHAIAVVCEGTRLTYEELNERANQLARYLRANGVRPNDLVAISLERGVELIVGILAILKAGAAYVPVDPSYPAERVAFLLSDAAPTVVVTHSKLRPGLASGDARVISIDEDRRQIARQDKRNLDAEIMGKHLRDLAYVIYTSGSTGKPKGVMVEHANVTRLFAATEKWFHFDERDVWTLYHSFAFDFSVWELWGALLYGGRLVIVPHLTARSPDDFYRLLCDEEVTVLNQTPSAFVQLMGAQGREHTRNHNLRVVVFGGERLDPRVLRPWVERNGAEKPQLINMYGITETTVHVTYCPLGSHEILSEGGSVIGKPIPDLRVYVLDRHRQPTPLGVIGEMYVGGAGVARGYLNRPDLTAERFIEDRFSKVNGARLYKTGDLARWRGDGSLEYLGRNDSQVKVRGFRIEPGEIEAEIARFPGVKDVVVLPRNDAAGDDQLVAYIVPSAGNSLDGTLPGWMRSYGELRVKDTVCTDAGDVWVDHYTGLPFSVWEMKEWATSLAARVRELKGKAVLEISCGVGCVREALKPDVERAVAAVFGPAAFECLTVPAEDGGPADNELSTGGASQQLRQLSPQSFDVVVLNSIVNYFPDIEYLLASLREAIRLVRPGGGVLIGDVRNMRTLRGLLTSVHLARVPVQQTAADIRHRIAIMTTDVTELFIDPQWFLALPKHITGISGVEVHLKRGKHGNERTCHRYDVLIRVGDVAATEPACKALKWGVDVATIADLESVIGLTRPATVRICCIANRRIARDLAGETLLDASDGSTSADTLRQQLEAMRVDGIHPESILEASDRAGYEAVLTWSSEDVGAFDALLSKRGETHCARTVARVSDVSSASLDQYATEPRSRILQRYFVPDLRKYIKGRLPTHMVPAAFVTVNAFPLTPNGKLDRRALAETPMPAAQGSLALLPRTEVERLLVSVWEELLGTRGLGIRENFFELGGHSLLAMRLGARIWEHLHIAVPMKVIFDSPTIEELSRFLEGAVGSAEGGDPSSENALDIESMTPEELLSKISQLERALTSSAGP